MTADATAPASPDEESAYSFRKMQFALMALAFALYWSLGNYRFAKNLTPMVQQ